MKKNRKMETTLIVLFAVYALSCVLPLLLVVGGSFSKESDIYLYGYRFIPKVISTTAYRFILGNGTAILKAYGVSIIATLAGTFFGVLLTASLAYPISRQDFKHRNGFAFFVFFTMLFNGGMVPLYLVYTQLLDIKNTLWALIIPNMIGGFNVLLMRTFFAQNVPDSVVESAEIDGASLYRIFLQMVLPLSTPVIATVALFTGIGYWNDFFRNMLFIRDANLNGLQFLLYRITSSVRYINQNPEVARQFQGNLPDETARMAMVIIAVGPIIFLYPLLQKYFIKGLVVGAVKG